MLVFSEKLFFCKKNRLSGDFRLDKMPVMEYYKNGNLIDL